MVSGDQLTATLDAIERHRISGLEYWLLSTRPPLPDGDDEVRELIQWEAQIISEMHGARFVRLLPKLPKHYLRHVIDMEHFEERDEFFDQQRALELLARAPQELAQVWSALDFAAPQYARTRRNAFVSIETFAERLTADAAGGLLPIVSQGL